MKGKMIYLNNEFDVYDMGLVNLRNEYIMKANEYIDSHRDQYIIEAEGNAIQRATPVADNAWYIRWKVDSANLLKSNFAKFKQYAASQDNKYGVWLRNNKKYFDPSVYPAGKSCRLNNAPNYKNALIRIKEPITSAMNGIDIKRIEVSDDQANGDNGLNKNTTNTSNKWFMKFIIKSYTGDGTDFVKFAKNYYYGSDTKNNYNEQQINSMMVNMYNYCFNFKSIVSLLENQLQSLVTFINKDPVSGQQQSEMDARSQYNNLQSQKGNPNKTANTNATNNSMAVHQAATGLIPMRMDSILIEDISNITDTSKTASTGNVIGSASANTNVSNPTPDQVSHQKNTEPAGTPKMQVNEKLVLMKKKQVACGILRDTFQEKVTAAGKIYKDFITILQTHVAVIQENQIKKNNSKGK